MINNYKKGSVVKSPIIPEGNNATHYDQYGVGGYREVETIRDLQYINKNYLTIGCLVYVNENKQIYQYVKENTFKILYNDQWEALKNNIQDINNIIETNKQQQNNIDSNSSKIDNLKNNVDQISKNYKLELNNSGTNQLSLTNSVTNLSSTVDIPIASTDRPGEIKLGDKNTLNTQNTKNYPVQLDKDNRAYVNVPWTDTVTTVKSYRLALRTTNTNNIVLSDDDNNESVAELPIATATKLGEIKLGNPNLSIIKDRHYPVQYNGQDGAFVQVPWTDTINTDDITSQFTQFVFTRSYTKPATPTGGSYDNPFPVESIWSDSIPSGKDPVWCSHAIFLNRNISSISWSDPILLTDSATLDICYSNSNTKPDAPTTHGIQNSDVWHNDPLEDDIWMALSTKQSITAEWSEWRIFKIKGEDGKDGTSIHIVGTYDNKDCLLQVNSSIVSGISNSNIKFINPNHVKSVGDCLQVVDTCSETSLNNHIICLTDNNPEVWIDLGNIQGKEGKSSYIHVKWSNNVIIDARGHNVNHNATFTENNGETPGIYRGEYVDQNFPDSLNINDYKWIRARGQDGFSYWFFYTVTNTNTKPTDIPTVSSVSELQKTQLVTSSGVVWYDEIPTDSSIYDPETQYLWQIWIKDDVSPLQFHGPVLVQAPSAEGIAYNIVVNNTGIYYDLDTQSLVTTDSSSKVTWTVYKNENILHTSTDQQGYNPGDAQGGEIVIPKVEQNTEIRQTCETSQKLYATEYKWSDGTVVTSKQYIDSTNIKSNNTYIIIQLKKANALIYQYQYIFPVKGKKGDPGIPADTGITIILSNDIAHLVCNPDNTPINGVSVSTDIQVFKGETDITSNCILADSVSYQSSTSVKEYNSNNGIIHNTVSYNNNKFTLTSKLQPQQTPDTNFQYLVPIYVKYNGYIYTKYFTIRKDYTGDVYELIVTPQVYLEEDSSKNLSIKVNRIYSRTGNPTGVITSTSDSEFNKLKITINDGNKQSIIGYTAPKLTESSYDVKLYEQSNLIDEEVISRVKGSTGKQGIQGCILRNRGYWDSKVTDYTNMGEYTPQDTTEVRFIDYVFVRSNEEKCYLVNYYSKITDKSKITGTNGKVILNKNINPTTNHDSGGYWIEANNQELAYIKNLIAQNISAQTINADEYLVKRKFNDNTTQIVAGLIKGDNITYGSDNVVFFAGTNIPNSDNIDVTKLNTANAKTRLTEGGKLYTQEAQISGDIVAKSLIVSANAVSTKPNIIFTTYNKNSLVYTYDSKGNKVGNGVTMSTFDNIKDSAGNTISEGAPIGIVYMQDNNQYYIPKYFFNFAPLNTSTFYAANGYYAKLGDTTQIPLLQSKGKLYTDSDTPYTGNVWCKISAFIPSDSSSDVGNNHKLLSGNIWYQIPVNNGLISRTILNLGINILEVATKIPSTNLFQISSVNQWVTNFESDQIKSYSDTYPTNASDWTSQHFMGTYGIFNTQSSTTTSGGAIVNGYIYSPLSKGSLVLALMSSKPYVLSNNYLSSTNDYIINTLGTTNTITSLDLSKFANTNTVLGVTHFGSILSKETNYIICNVQSVLLKKEGNLYTLDKQYPIGGNT